ncbi:hypothetical protein AAG570_002773 [Ranatra chinensis]|uniref:Catenin alpha n=1 Tax=Ranatra chinensis TaxID=642074 RepID=A0ABD0YHA5_9HEMI
MMADHFGQIALKWDPKNLEIRTMSVEKTLEPLVLQVTTLVNTKGPSKKKKGRSKRAHVLVAAVEKATENFIEKGEMIAYENPDIKQEMLSAVEEVRKTGEAMSIAAREFADDPCLSAKRGNMVRAARNLLSAVTRLLILADMVDVHLLLKSLRVVEDDLEKVKNASSQGELLDNIKAFGRNASELMSQAAKRQLELKDPQLRDDLAAARAILKKHSTMLLTASKVYVRHPELAAAKANRDYVFKQVCEAVNTISDVAQGKNPTINSSNAYEGPGELAAAIDDFDERMVMEPVAYNEVRTRPSLEERLESIISGAALMADSSCTRDERRERIVAECNAVRQALQDLLSEYMANQLQLQRGGKRMSVKEQSEGLERAIDHMCRKTRDLRRQLRKAVVDHVSDSFLETSVPLLVLIEAARAGNEKEVEEYAIVFTEHANKLVEVANLTCSMSGNEDGVKMVRYAAGQIEALCPQVINAARILAARPRSKVAQENMDVFRDAWENQVRVLTEAVDDITTIDDFLAVSENHILEDVNKCVLALQEGDGDCLDRTAGAIRGRSSRVANVVTSEMDNYEPGIYTERVLEAIKVLRDQVMPNFAQRVEVAVDALSSNPPKDVDENEFIDASRLVYDGVREIRRAVLMNRSSEELDTDTEFEPCEDMTIDTRSRSSAHTGEHGVDEYPDISGITTAREAMRKMTEEDKQKIAQQVEVFRTEKLKFDREVAKWDDTGNDIIVLAKHMCMIMMEMTDFTRGRGPLKTTMDVINAAKKISEAGTKLDKLTRQIADQCPESSTKKDLLAYLQRIALYCHQLNITSKVKADVQNISGELIVSGLDSATSLIQAAKNLMNAVVLTVKASYVASTKYPRQGTVAEVTECDRFERGFTWFYFPVSPTVSILFSVSLSPIVVWKMKAPEKKPLVRPEKPEEVRAKVRKGSQKKVQNPIKVLSEFQSPAESV